MAVRRDDPYAAFNYKVTATVKSGVEVRGAFSDVSGLSTEVTYADYREGTEPNHVRKIPTLYKVGDITLKRGVIGAVELYQWMDQVRRGNQDAKATVVIELRAENGTDVVGSWTLSNARPQKWTGPTLGAKSTDVAMEELVLVCEDMVFE